eukprot:11795423-Alexandrium_andersonii.AAC.1
MAGDKCAKGPRCVSLLVSLSGPRPLPQQTGRCQQGDSYPHAQHERGHHADEWICTCKRHDQC